MPRITSGRVGVTVDMAGCPNRCRHCWLGHGTDQGMSEEALRWVVQQFRSYRRPDDVKPVFDQIIVQTWFREPDRLPEYRRLWELEKELSYPGGALRFELASSWRLAREQDYAAWLKEVGTKVVQISFFGLEANTDYFTRRAGSFQDNLLATERLLDQSIAPRWQLFLSNRVIDELDAFVELIQELKLEERVARLGKEFVVFVNLPTPVGEAFVHEHLRPSAQVLDRLPKYLSDKTIKHFQAVDLSSALGKPESAWLPELSQNNEPYAQTPSLLAFLVTPELEVFTNLGELTPAWSLGNLERDGIKEIIRRYEFDVVLGLQGFYHVPVSTLATTYGRKDSALLYGKGDLITRWLKLWADEKTSGAL
ncbi:MAG: radical SAM protein [Limnochordia bacterium]|nr:radical SAM protein [Limnochordia bacterium]